ncbi:hypothetical protein LIER_05945 [Lithospermum erythrorhizon]|uniref:Uncharacterized protein n=1 Tax=Lithospermum erythrorhizon TaxID=34254 RepID=A0AAV3P2Q1_LITER
MVRYHAKGTGKVYASSDARTALHLCLVTWKAIRPDREYPFFYNDHESQWPLDQALFVSLHTGKRSSSSTVEDKDPKHAKGARKETSSSRGSRVVSPVRKSPKAVTPYLVPDNVIRDQCLAIEVAESHPPAPPALSIAQRVEAILRTRASSLWAWQVAGFLSGGKEDDCSFAVVSPANTSETLQKLSLLKVSLEDQPSKKQCEVQKIEKLEQEVVEMETRTRDLRFQVQEQKSIIFQLDLKTTNTSRQIDILEKEIQAEQASS